MSPTATSPRPKRKFIIADSPGHVQYTRNMVTGASTAELALILVDARKGVIEQTRRHSAIASLLGIRHLVLCVNKMDLVDWSEARRSTRSSAEFRDLRPHLGVPTVTVIPMAAVTGENIVDRGQRACPGTRARPARVSRDGRSRRTRRSHAALRFPVQYVIRPGSDEFHDYRGYAGTVAAGAVRVGQDVHGAALSAGPRPSPRSTGSRKRFHRAGSGEAVTIRLADNLDVGRGQMIVSASDPAPMVARFTADICWMSDTAALAPGAQFLVKHTTRRVRCVVESIEDRLDIQTLQRVAAPVELALNDIGRVTIRTTEPLFADPYEVSRDTGSFILIDPATRLTVAAGMLREVRRSPGAASSRCPVAHRTRRRCPFLPSRHSCKYLTGAGTGWALGYVGSPQLQASCCLSSRCKSSRPAPARCSRCSMG